MCCDEPLSDQSCVAELGCIAYLCVWDWGAVLMCGAVDYLKVEVLQRGGQAESVGAVCAGEVGEGDESGVSEGSGDPAGVVLSCVEVGHQLAYGVVPGCDGFEVVVLEGGYSWGHRSTSACRGLVAGLSP